MGSTALSNRRLYSRLQSASLSSSTHERSRGNTSGGVRHRRRHGDGSNSCSDERTVTSIVCYDRHNLACTVFQHWACVLVSWHGSLEILHLPQPRNCTWCSDWQDFDRWLGAQDRKGVISCLVLTGHHSSICSPHAHFGTL